MCRPNILNGYDAMMMTSTRKLIMRGATCQVSLRKIIRIPIIGGSRYERYRTRYSDGLKKKRRPLELPIYETEATRPRHVDTSIQTYKDDDSPGFVGDYVMPEDEEIARFGETHFGRIATRYLSQYVGGIRSIDTVVRD